MTFGMKKKNPKSTALAQVVPELMKLYSTQQQEMKVLNAKVTAFEREIMCLPDFMQEINSRFCDLGMHHTLIMEETEASHKLKFDKMEHALEMARTEAKDARALAMNLMLELDQQSKLHQNQEPQQPARHLVPITPEQNYPCTNTSPSIKSIITPAAQRRYKMTVPDLTKSSDDQMKQVPSRLHEEKHNEITPPVDFDSTPVQSNKKNRVHWSLVCGKASIQDAEKICGKTSTIAANATLPDSLSAKDSLSTCSENPSSSPQQK